MRIAVFADVHGNPLALEAVLSDMASRSPDVTVNPGSVGLPGFYDDAPYPHVIQCGSPHARYAVLEGSGEHWRVEFAAVEYDWTSAAALAAKSGSPWARAIATGYAQTP
jgi:hypothetical protein